MRPLVICALLVFPLSTAADPKSPRVSMRTPGENAGPCTLKLKKGAPAPTAQVTGQKRNYDSIMYMPDSKADIQRLRHCSKQAESKVAGDNAGDSLAVQRDALTNAFEQCIGTRLEAAINSRPTFTVRQTECVPTDGS